MKRTVYHEQKSATTAEISKRSGILLLLMGALIVASICIAGCMSGTLAAGNDSSPDMNSNSILPLERVEVYHFHRTQQCSTCIMVGSLAEETVKTRFSDELKTGKVVFGHINIELPENRELVEQYGATGPSLWIGVYDQNGFHKEEDTHVWYKIGNEDDYTQYLSNLIDRRMNGDYT